MFVVDMKLVWDRCVYKFYLIMEQLSFCSRMKAYFVKVELLPRKEMEEEEEEEDLLDEI